MDSRRVRESELSGSRDIAIKCFVLGLFLSPIAAVIIAILVWFADQYGIDDGKYIVLFSICTYCVIYFGVPWSLLKEYHFHLRTRRLALLAAFAYTIGFHGCPAGGTLITHDKYALFLDSLLLLMRIAVSLVVYTAVTWGFAIFVCNRFAKRCPVLISYWPPKCKCCGYDLIGNQSQTCPECGEVFSYDEFGMTETEFRDLQKLTRPVTPDITNR